MPNKILRVFTIIIKFNLLVVELYVEITEYLMLEQHFIDDECSFGRFARVIESALIFLGRCDTGSC